MNIRDDADIPGGIDDAPADVHPGWAQVDAQTYDSGDSGGWGSPGEAATGPIRIPGLSRAAHRRPTHAEDVSTADPESDR